MAARTASALTLAVLLLGAFPAAGQEQKSDVPVFRAGTELVDLYVTATDRNGRLVPDLRQFSSAAESRAVPPAVA